MVEKLEHLEIMKEVPFGTFFWADWNSLLAHSHVHPKDAPLPDTTCKFGIAGHVDGQIGIGFVTNNSEL